MTVVCVCVRMDIKYSKVIQLSVKRLSRNLLCGGGGSRIHKTMKGTHGLKKEENQFPCTCGGIRPGWVEPASPVELTTSRVEALETFT